MVEKSMANKNGQQKVMDNPREKIDELSAKNEGDPKKWGTIHDYFKANPINCIAFITFAAAIPSLGHLAIIGEREWRKAESFGIDGMLMSCAAHSVAPLCITSSISLFYGAKKENRIFLAMYFLLTFPLILYNIILTIISLWMCYAFAGVIIADYIKTIESDDVEHNKQEGKTLSAAEKFGFSMFLIVGLLAVLKLAHLQIRSWCLVYKFTKQIPTKTTTKSKN